MNLEIKTSNPGTSQSDHVLLNVALMIRQPAFDTT